MVRLVWRLHSAPVFIRKRDITKKYEWLNNLQSTCCNTLWNVHLPLIYMYMPVEVNLYHKKIQ